MFTGIITHTGTIIRAEPRGDLRLAIACDFPPESLVIGESIACNGCCLTVVEKGGIGDWGLGISEIANPQSPTPNPFFTVDLSAETLARAAPGCWEIGQRLNLERSLRLGDALDGHLVSGHVDGVAVVEQVIPEGDSHVVGLRAPAELARFLAEKGSVTLDGVSLTVNKVVHNLFFVNIIPHTWQTTTLGERKTGDGLNMEIDMIARYVARLLQTSL